jgi:mannose-6-phosphate isomerase-like protein (cupin superfamily)
MMKLGLVKRGVVIAVLAGVGAGAAVLARAGGKPVLWAAGDIKWADIPAVKGAQMATLWGDPKTGAYGSLKKLPGGSKLALHTHSQDQKVVVVSGTITLSMQGGESKDMTAGSYSEIPAGAPHSADCKAGADCVYFEEQPGASDIKFVESAPAKK